MAARGVPSKYPIIKGISNYGNCREREGFQEATTLEMPCLTSI
jgi:hypothetical protein